MLDSQKPLQPVTTSEDIKTSIKEVWEALQYAKKEQPRYDHVTTSVAAIVAAIDHHTEAIKKLNDQIEILNGALTRKRI